MIRGWVYVLTNKAMLGLVKIGFSTKDPSLRADELQGTGLPHPFEVVYDVLVLEPRDVEQQVHQELKVHHEAKEFFRIDAGTAIQTIHNVIVMQGKTRLYETPHADLLNLSGSNEIKQKPWSPYTENDYRYDNSVVIGCPNCRGNMLLSDFRCNRCGVENRWHQSKRTS